MGCLLWQRGALPLHASSIAIDGTVAAFIGVSGAGKSTIAASLCRLGHTLIADDITSIQTKGCPQAVPAFPRIRLLPAVVNEFGDMATCVTSKVDDKVTIPPERFSDSSLPLGAIYVLDPQGEPGITAVTPHEKMLELIRHSYPTRLVHSPGPEHFRRCAALADSTPIYRIRPTDGVSALPRLCAEIERHFRHARVWGRAGVQAFQPVAGNAP